MQALIIAGALAAAVAGCAASSAAMWAYDTYIDDPAIVAAERARLTAEFTAETAQIVAAEQLRQFHIGERAFEQFYQAKQEDEAWAAAARNLYQMELASYAAERDATGGACGLTQRDLDYLDGRILQPDGPAAGGK